MKYWSVKELAEVLEDSGMLVFKIEIDPTTQELSSSTITIEIGTEDYRGEKESPSLQGERS